MKRDRGALLDYETSKDEFELKVAGIIEISIIFKLPPPFFSGFYFIIDKKNFPTSLLKNIIHYTRRKFVSTPRFVSTDLPEIRAEWNPPHHFFTSVKGTAISTRSEKKRDWNIECGRTCKKLAVYAANIISWGGGARRILRG